MELGDKNDLSTNYTFIIGCAVVIAELIIVLAIYRICYAYSPPIVAILALLLLNELL